MCNHRQNELYSSKQTLFIVESHGTEVHHLFIFIHQLDSMVNSRIIKPKFLLYTYFFSHKKPTWQHRDEF